MQLLFNHFAVQPVVLSVVRHKGCSTLYFVIPPSLKFKKAAALMQCCRERSERRGAQFQGMITEEIGAKKKTVPHIVGRVVVLQRREKKLTKELRAVLQQVLHAPVVIVVR